jgi:hypothetical protein
VRVRVERVEPEVMQRDHDGGDDRHAPVAVDEQEREAGEDVEVQLHHALALVDEEPGVGHEADGDGEPRLDRAGAGARHVERDRRHGTADDERRRPRVVHPGDGEGDGKMGEEQPGQRAVGAGADAEQRVLGCGGHVRAFGLSALGLESIVRPELGLRH